jgi:hypothetical protein
MVVPQDALLLVKEQDLMARVGYIVPSDRFPARKTKIPASLGFGDV